MHCRALALRLDSFLTELLSPCLRFLPPQIDFHFLSTPLLYILFSTLAGVARFTTAANNSSCRHFSITSALHRRTLPVVSEVPHIPSGKCSKKMDAKSDTYVTALDVFERRAYFDPLKSANGDAKPNTFGTIDAQPQQPGYSQANGHSFSETPNNCGTSDTDTALSESAVCKLKRFSSPAAYSIANSVKDDLENALGESNSTQIYVDRELLLEKRRLFFETLFTHGDDFRTALPCRFSIEDVDQMFQSDKTSKTDASSLYRRRLAALDQLRETLDC